MQTVAARRGARRFWSGDLSTADNIHRYPAKMALNLAADFFETTVPKFFPDTKGVAFHDPFTGSGTTLLVARSHGACATGSDLLKSSVLLARAKNNRLSPNAVGELRRWLLEDPLTHETTPRALSWPQWDIWFAGRTVRALEDLRDSILVERRKAHFPHLFTALSQTAWDVSSADPDVMVPTHSSRARGIRDVSPLAVLNQFRQRLNRILTAQAALRRLDVDTKPARIWQGDALAWASWPRRTRLILTSPPYGLGLDYVRASTFPLQLLLAEDTRTERERMIGRRCHLAADDRSIPDAFARSRNLQEMFVRVVENEPRRFDAFCQYVEDMREFLIIAKERLASDGILGVVIGEPEMAGERVPLVEMTRCLAAEAGLVERLPPKKDPIRRRFQAKTRRSSSAPITHEVLLTLGT